MCVEFVVNVDFRLGPRFLLELWLFRFSSLHKNHISRFQLDQDREPAWNPAKADVASSINIVIYLVIYMYL